MAFPELRLFPVTPLPLEMDTPHLHKHAGALEDLNDVNSADFSDDSEEEGSDRDLILHSFEMGVRLTGTVHVREFAVVNIGTGNLPFRVDFALTKYNNKDVDTADEMETMV